MTSPALSPPFSKSRQLCNELDDYDPSDRLVPSLLGHPTLLMNNVPAVMRKLEHEFYSKDLDRFAPHLWIMTTYSSANINALHRQRVKGREIIVTEEPRLHMVWVRDRIFIKPLPVYLLSHSFWNVFFGQMPAETNSNQKKIYRAALGFLRTYSYLIQHQSDFAIAKQDHLRLIPAEMDWSQFCLLMSEVKDNINDAHVSERYH